MDLVKKKKWIGRLVVDLVKKKKWEVDTSCGSHKDERILTNQHSQSFTSQDQLADCQHNLVGGEENQTNQVQTWRNEMGPQGLSLPSGGSEAVFTSGIFKPLKLK